MALCPKITLIILCRVFTNYHNVLYFSSSRQYESIYNNYHHRKYLRPCTVVVYVRVLENSRNSQMDLYLYHNRTGSPCQRLNFPRQSPPTLDSAKPQPRKERDCTVETVAECHVRFYWRCETVKSWLTGFFLNRVQVYSSSPWSG